MTAELPGFKKTASGHFELNVNQSMEIDLRLEVGLVTEHVQVLAAAPLLQTADSQLGNLIETRRVVELPLAARDFMQLTLLSAGVTESNGNRRHQTERATWIGSFSVHGHNPTYNQYLFDGIPGKEAAHQTNGRRCSFAPRLLTPPITRTGGRLEARWVRRPSAPSPPTTIFRECCSSG